MEFLSGLLAALVVTVLLAGVGLAAIVGLGVMAVLHFLTEMDFRKVFAVSAGVGLLAPILLAVGIGSALEDGSYETDLRDEIGDIIQLPEDRGDKWSEALPKLQEIGRANERGELTDEEAEARAMEILGEFEDLQIGIDVNGDGVVTSNSDNGVPLDLPDQTEVEAPNRGQ